MDGPRAGRRSSRTGLAAAQSAGDFEGGADGEDREQRWHRDHSGENGMKKLEACTDLRIDEQVMNADGHREDEELQERDPPHLIAIQAAAGGLRQQQ